ncbi:hypothetical protein OV320_1430 [Actinobacteria bacterium OV320]|nr:hypothetical protein OV320_1430 [Actinobacteria bacterium OV320]
MDALARALLLEPDEVDHLRSLAAIAARASPELPATPSRTVRPGVKLLLENLRPAPAYVVSRTNDLLAANPAGLRLLAVIEEWPAKERNVARYVFLHPAARDLFVDWGTQARGCVAHLRALVGTDPEAPGLTRLVGELVLKSSEFAGLWKRYDVKNRSYGKKTFHHPRSATSPSATSLCSWKPPPATTCSRTTPNPAPPITTRSPSSTSWPSSRIPGRRHRVRHRPPRPDTTGERHRSGRAGRVGLTRLLPRSAARSTFRHAGPSPW